MKQILKVESAIITQIFFDSSIQLQQIDLGIPEDGIAEQTSSKTQYLQQGVSTIC
jgi:hypothetical protein